jgi:hypothetical protein
MPEVQILPRPRLMDKRYNILRAAPAVLSM